MIVIQSITLTVVLVEPPWKSICGDGRHGRSRLLKDTVTAAIPIS
jgi:hypothetical protein